MKKEWTAKAEGAAVRVAMNGSRYSKRKRKRVKAGEMNTHSPTSSQPTTAANPPFRVHCLFSSSFSLRLYLMIDCIHQLLNRYCHSRF